MNFRLGLPEDVQYLNELALVAKAYWGYSASQLEAWRRGLEVRPEELEKRPVCVAEHGGHIVGFAQVATDVQPWEIWSMWVHPLHMRKDIGTGLLSWAKRLASESGQRQLAIDSDPNAEPFYIACGAKRVGEVAAPIHGQPERVRPQLLISTSAA